MNIMDLKNQIMKNELKNFYIFTGTEIGIMNIYLEEMSNKVNLPITRADSVSSIYTRCMGGSLFGDDVGFYVIREDMDFMKAEDAYQTISDDIMAGNIIVLLYEKIDSRIKFGKHFKDEIIHFDKLTPQVLSGYIKKRIDLSNNNIERLIELCSQSYDMCMLEVDKILQYQQSSVDIAGSVYTADHCFEYLLNSGAIYQPEESDVFKFTGAVCSRNVNEALYFEEMLRDNGSTAVAMLGALYSSMKAVMLIQLCEDKDVSNTTGLDGRQIYFNKKFVGKYSDTELVRAVKLIMRTVSDIKGGRIDDIYATKYVLASIM